MQRDSLAQRAWYQGYQGVPTHRVSGTKDSACGTSRVLGCRETHWHRERGTRGIKGYQHIELVVPKTQHVVPAEYWGAERLTAWNRESGTRGTKGTEGYQHRVSGTKDSKIWHNRLRFIAVFNCFYLFSRFKNLGGDMRTNIKENNPTEKVLNNGSKFDS